MQELAQMLSTNDVWLTYGVIRSCLSDSFQVQDATGLTTAHKAAGCLLQPEPGDRVLLSASPGGQCFILTVLSRNNAKQATLEVAGDLLVRSSGTVQLQGKEVEVAGQEKVSLVGHDLSLAAVSAEARIGSFSFLGKIFTAHLTRTKTVIGAMDITVGRMMQRIKRVYRRVDDFEDVKVGRLRYLVRNSLFMRGKNTTIEAEKTAAVNGDKVQLG